MLLVPATHWEADYITAQKKAKENHRLILLNFSGSDWCIPCIRMHKDVFEKPAFTALSDSLLVLYNADFPRQKKNKLSPVLQKQNDSLAAVYNPEGKFPFTLLLTPEGKIVHQWEGYPEKGLPAFISEVKKAVHASNY